MQITITSLPVLYPEINNRILTQQNNFEAPEREPRSCHLNLKRYGVDSFISPRDYGRKELLRPMRCRLHASCNVNERTRGSSALQGRPSRSETGSEQSLHNGRQGWSIFGTKFAAVQSSWASYITLARGEPGASAKTSDGVLMDSAEAGMKAAGQQDEWSRLLDESPPDSDVDDFQSGDSGISDQTNKYAADLSRGAMISGLLCVFVSKFSMGPMLHLLKGTRSRLFSAASGYLAAGSRANAFRGLGFAAIIIAAGLVTAARAHMQEAGAAPFCDTCDGSGTRTCGICGGHGEIVWEGKMQHRDPCPACFGARKKKCDSCGGFSRPSGQSPSAS